MYNIADFTKTAAGYWISSDGKYALTVDGGGYMYPCEVGVNGLFRMVHTSYDYTFRLKTCLQVLNMVLDGTWKHGEGTYLNFKEKN